MDKQEIVGAHGHSPEEEDHLFRSIKRVKESAELSSNSINGSSMDQDIDPVVLPGHAMSSSPKLDKKFVDVVRGSKEGVAPKFLSHESMMLDLDKIKIFPPLEKDPYHSVTLKPKFRASLEIL